MIMSDAEPARPMLVGRSGNDLLLRVGSAPATSVIHSQITTIAATLQNTAKAQPPR